MVEVVNAVASGSLGVELALDALAADLDDVVDYDPDKYPGAYFRFGSNSPLITVYRTGKYIITGATSEKEAYTLREQFLDLLHDHGVLDQPDDEWFRMQNFVCTAELEEPANLNALAIGLGLERTEYEPEQFPGLVYRPENGDAVLLVFGSGKVVITGAKSVDKAHATFENFREELAALL